MGIGMSLTVPGGELPGSRDALGGGQFSWGSSARDRRHRSLSLRVCIQKQSMDSRSSALECALDTMLGCVDRIG